MLTAIAKHLAASDFSGQAEFVENSAYGGFADGARSREASVQVEAATVDDLVAEMGWNRVDFIKIDVEGAERRVLQGAKVTLQESNPVLLMEFNAWALLAYGSTDPLDFARELFREFEYVAVLGANGMLRPITDPRLFVETHIFALPKVTDLV